MTQGAARMTRPVRRIGLHTLAALEAWLLPIAASAELLDDALTRGELRQRFAVLRAANTKVDAPLEWQFVFSGNDPRRLEALSVRLVNDGYRIVSLAAAQAQSAGRLRVARVEQHTPTSLERRNRELRAIASEYSGAAYEGVEPLAAH